MSSASLPVQILTLSFVVSFRYLWLGIWAAFPR